MRRDNSTFLIFLLVGTIFLTVGFYNNNFQVVEQQHYRIWGRVYERVVIGRLAKSQQDGILSAGGLLGLVNSPDGWNFDPDSQYAYYEEGTWVEDYVVYKSHPGIQGLVFSVLDRATNLSPALNIIMMRLMTTLLSASILALFCAWLAVEFSWLSAVMVLLFSAASEWMILPASNAYWNLWAFYLPFITGILLLGDATRKKTFDARKIYGMIFFAMIIKVWFTGFEMITTVLVMSTVPFVYYAINKKWGWRQLLIQLSALSVILLAATLAGLATLALQIAFNDNSIKSAYQHIENTLDRRAFGNPEDYKDIHAESMRTSAAGSG